MTIPQTTYTLVPALARAGMMADGEHHVDSLLADVAMAPGLAVVTGAAHGECKLPTAASDVSAHFRGVAIYSPMKMPVAGSANTYAIADAVPVVRRGRVWVKPEGDMVDDGPVYVVNGSGAGTAGMFRGDANAGAATVLSRAVCMIGATAASGLFALVEINVP